MKVTRSLLAFHGAIICSQVHLVAGNRIWGLVWIVAAVLFIVVDALDSRDDRRALE